MSLQIPGHHLAPVIFTAFAVYITSVRSLLQRSIDDEAGEASKPETKRTGSRGAALVTLLTGLPSVSWPKVTVCTACINVLLALLALDFLGRGVLFYPSGKLAFSRVGYVSPTTASLLVREPDPAQLPLVVYYQEVAGEDSGKWIEDGIIYQTDDSTDFTVPVILRDLKPFTKYRYSLSNNLTGSFITAPFPGTDGASRLSFLTSSCMKPNFPYNPFSHPLRIPGIETMSAAIAKLPAYLRPSFMLFLGDFIYIDVPERFGSSKSHYRSEYRRIYSSPSWNVPQDNPAISLPWLHTLDDHEIENDWAKGNLTSPYPAAADPFVHYHVSVNPPIPPLPFAKRENTTYFSFIHGPASFFMLDTRTYRSEPARPNSTILGSAQLQSLLTYLARPEPAEVRWKIISSSVPFTKNWHVGTTDTWGGFLRERRTVFEAMWRAERDVGVRVVLLSGDRHEFAATRFPDPLLHPSPDDTSPLTAGEGVHEFSVGPLSMFYLPIRTYRQTDDEDVSIKYAPDGNTKFGLIDISTYEEEIEDASGNTLSPVSTVTVPCSVLTYSLYVDGEAVWKYRLSAPMTGYAAPAAGERSSRFPPGRVLLDDIEKDSWGSYLKTRIGRVEEVGARLWKRTTDTYLELLEGVRKSGRLD